MARLLSGVVAWALAAVLGGCGLYGGKTPEVPCPKASVLGDAADITRFRPGQGLDPANIDFTARIADLSLQCALADGNQTHLTFLKVKIAAQAPNPQMGPATAPFFVAIVDSEQRILAKEVFEAKFPFDFDLRTVEAETETEQRIPISPQRPIANFEILVGFQLTAEELAWNRQNRR
jgi:hypothetical protein